MIRAPLMLAVLSLLLAGCAEEQKKKTAARPSATPVADHADLREHLPVKGDLDEGDPNDATFTDDPAEWAAWTGHLNTKEISTIGFAEGMKQDHPPFGSVLGEAQSVVARFKTAGEAQAEVERGPQFDPEEPPYERVRVTSFAVPSIPGAVGYKTVGESIDAHRVHFAAGEYFHGVGSDRDRASRAKVIAAAERLYERVK